MKTLGGSACPLLPAFLVQVVMCVFLRVQAVSVCVVLLKSSHLSVTDDTDLHADRQEAGKAAGLWWSPGHPLFPFPSRFRARGFRLMKRVWTTKKNGSHLPDTPAHLWPSESSPHDRPPPPLLPSALSPHVDPPSPGSNHVVWLPGRCQTRLSHGGIEAAEERPERI